MYNYLNIIVLVELNMKPNVKAELLFYQIIFLNLVLKSNQSFTVKKKIDRKDFARNFSTN